MMWFSVSSSLYLPMDKSDQIRNKLELRKYFPPLSTHTKKTQVATIFYIYNTNESLELEAKNYKCLGWNEVQSQKAVKIKNFWTMWQIVISREQFSEMPPRRQK